MAKLSDFATALTHTDDALIYIVDNSASAPTSKAIQAQNLVGARDYGIISCADNSTTQTIVADTWTKIDRFSVATAGLQNGVTAVASAGGDHYLRPTRTGYWLCSYTASIASAGAGGTIHTRLYMKTTGDTTSQAAHKLDTNYTGNFTASTIIDIDDITTSATEGDISLWVKSTHTVVTMSNAQLIIERLAST